MSWQRIAQAVRACAVGAVVVATAGCGERGGSSLSVDKDLARQALTSFLDCWTKGETVESLQSKSPKIIGRDPAWEGGQKLVSYKVGAESDDGANLHVKVELVLGNASGAKSSQSVTYIVGTSPVITVFRNE